MRILFASHHASRVAGAETYVDAVATALAARGHDVALVSELRPVDGRDPIDGPHTRWCAAEGGEADAISAARRWSPEIVYVHGVRSLNLERALIRTARPVLFEHSYAGLCISGSRTWQSSGTVCRRTLGPGCLAHYFPHQCGGLSPLTMARDYLLQRSRARLHRAYQAIVVASRCMEEALAASGCTAPVHVLALPVMPPNTDLPRRVGRSLTVLYVGRLERLKGAHLLLDAASLASDRLGRPIDLHIAGDGPLRAMLESQSRQPSSPGVRIVLHRWQTTAQRDELLAAADAIVMPSLWPEPFGLVGLEAARFGVPSVAFASGGIPDWLVDDLNGLLVKNRTTAALGEALAALLVDDARYERLSCGALAAARAAAIGAHAAALERLFAGIRS